jgi:hypothetical protein
VEQGRPAVVHLCSPESAFCARIDLALEALARKFLGTIFRRVRLSAIDASGGQRASWLEDLGVPAVRAQAGFGLLVFAGAEGGEGFLEIGNGGRVSQEVFGSSMKRFGSDHGVYVEELERFLGQSKALHSDPPSRLQLTRWGVLSRDAQIVGDGSADIENFCDLPGCTRRFKHEHVGTNGSGAKGSSLTKLAVTSQDGADALNITELLRV